jgi:hypothetical protein
MRTGLKPKPKPKRETHDACPFAKRMKKRDTYLLKHPNTPWRAPTHEEQEICHCVRRAPKRVMSELPSKGRNYRAFCGPVLRSAFCGNSFQSAQDAAQCNTSLSKFKPGRHWIWGEKGGNHRGQPKCAHCKLRSYLVIGEVEKCIGVLYKFQW